jgi:hypothetical protein
MAPLGDHETEVQSCALDAVLCWLLTPGPQVTIRADQLDADIFRRGLLTMNLVTEGPCAYTDMSHVL